MSGSPPTKSKDLRKQSPLERWQTECELLDARAKGASLRKLAKDYGINFRTVKKIVDGDSTIPGKLTSPLTGVVGVLLERLQHRSVEDVVKELSYRPKTSKKAMFHLGITRDSFFTHFAEQGFLDCRWTSKEGKQRPARVSPETFFNRRMPDGNLRRIEKNGPVLKLLLKGVIPDKGQFLRANLPVFKVGIELHGDLLPREILHELRFCFWLMFGSEGMEWLDQVNRDRFRWHVWKVRKSYQQI